MNSSIPCLSLIPRVLIQPMSTLAHVGCSHDDSFIAQHISRTFHLKKIFDALQVYFQYRHVSMELIMLDNVEQLRSPQLLDYALIN